MDLQLYDSTYQLEDTHWWFVGRRAIVLQELAHELDARGPNPRMLDIGCGTGRNLVELARLGSVVGLDIEQRALGYARERGAGQLVQSSAECLPFAASSFDVITALDLMEHLTDDAAGAREVFRILRPGGSFLAFVPAYQWLWGPQDDVSHHQRRYTPERARWMLESTGFEVRRLTHANLLLMPLILGGRLALRLASARIATENTLHPGWSNRVLREIFSSERLLLNHMDLPLGVSLLCVAAKPSGRADSSRASQEEASVRNLR